jgi:membrane associated rhomboid family serine protease
MTERTGFRALLPVVLIWVGINLFFGLYGMPGETSAIAWTVHIGGFLGGLFLYRPIARLKI